MLISFRVHNCNQKLFKTNNISASNISVFATKWLSHIEARKEAAATLVVTQALTFSCRTSFVQLIGPIHFFGTAFKSVHALVLKAVIQPSTFYI